MKKLWTNGRLAGYGFLLAVCCAMFMAAGVNGIFNNVNSTLGYQIAGGAGSSGQVLCSDGTRFNTPCSSLPGQITNITTSAPITGGGSSGTVNIAATTIGTGSSLVVANSIIGSATGALRATALGTSGNCMVWAASGAADSGSPCPTGSSQYVLAWSTCTPANSTDAGCTGTVTLSPGWSDTSYTVVATPASTAGAFMNFTVTGKSNGSFTYALSCSFNCSSYGTLTVDVQTHHN